MRLNFSRIPFAALAAPPAGGGGRSGGRMAAALSPRAVLARYFALTTSP